jgi:hypothetical protein
MPGWQAALCIMMLVQGDSQLTELILTRRTGGRSPDFLNAGSRQADKDSEDGDDDQQLNQSVGLTHHVVVPGRRGTTEPMNDRANPNTGIAIDLQLIFASEAPKHPQEMSSWRIIADVWRRQNVMKKSAERIYPVRKNRTSKSKNSARVS